MKGFSMLLEASWFSKIVDMITGFLAIIPQVMYFLYACCASFLDLLQYLIRKLAGLDVYYVNGQEVEGDIVTSFIRGILGIDVDPAYSALTTVFWSLVIFGVILLVLTTIFAIIKAHYNYDAKKGHPMIIIGSSLKTLALMAIVPIVSVFGLYLSQVLLKTLDEITSYSSAGLSAFDSAGEKDENGNIKNVLIEYFEGGYTNKTQAEKGDEGKKVYTSYDLFGFGPYTNTVTFSGVMFKTAAYECNRVRAGSYSADATGNWENFGVFKSTATGLEQVAEVADQIDYAFANNLRLKEGKTVVMEHDEDSPLATSLMNPYGLMINAQLINVTRFSKYNVALVFYYYNLWGFNFIIAFAGISAFITIMCNIVFGLMTRLIQLLALFFVFPPLVGIMPLDDGSAFKKWRQQYISDVLMAFGAIIGMNILFLILPFLNTISFFNIMFLDNIMNIFIMLAALTMVKKMISLISGFIGASDANAVGEETKKAVGELGAKAINAVAGAASVGVNVAKFGMTGSAAIGSKILSAHPKKGGRSIGEWASDGLKSAFTQAGRDARFNKRHFKSEADFQKEAREEAIRNADAEGRSVTRDELAAADAKGTERFRENQAKIVGRYNRRADRRRNWDTVVKGAKKVGRAFATGAAGVAVAFGADPVKEDKFGRFDAAATLKGAGQGFLDISNAAIKLTAGSVLNGNTAMQSLAEKGVFDSFKGLTKTSLNAVGVDKFDKTLKTKDEKDKDDKEDAKKQGENLSGIAEQTQKTNAALDDIKHLLEGIH